ncbi:hypothetical protein HPY42_06500 [Coprothermobacteraceae bacterium]|nr:hypothetical protein [Coprothermobacteraceae bacterium]
MGLGISVGIGTILLLALLYIVPTTIQAKATDKMHEKHMQLETALACFTLGLPLAAILWLIFSWELGALGVLIVSYTLGCFLGLMGLQGWG